ncbi:MULTISPECIES: MFS transporter [unclassified Arthrobacter]|uniref:MFS transporter n=1 Tax=unclassified Arthrobacter TaxID=235627 RepID=UPI002107DB49|nr:MULTISPECIES: MFS transporter [unclassified Arthrobacter]MCQ1986925.1 MFS transporter [Arthrobacter sp. zg-Y844]MCQ1995591.1 MFS transporter [Arthrobacter sp. zg-Y1171]UWX83317.1 MFS transporter [Arthrobacter sp. zg-Y1171]
MTERPAARKGARTFPDWLVIATLGCGGIVVSLEKTAVVPLLPEYPRIFGVTSDDVSWLVTVTLLSAAVATPIVSRLADMYGKRRMLLVAMALMVAGAFTASIGGTFTWALVGRGLQGLAGAVIPVGISILRETLPQKKIAGAVALMSASFGIGSALGLPLAGLVYARLGWQGTFWVVGVIGALVIAAVVVFVPESKVRNPAPFDYVGALLLSAAMTAVLLAITKGGVWGWTSYPILGLFAAAAVCFALWFPAELRNGQPLVDLRTSALRPVLLTNIGAVLVGFSMYANMLVTTQQLQLSKETGYGFGLSVLAAGLTMIPSGLAMVAASPVSARITNTYGAKVTLVTGCTVMAAGYLARILFVHTVPQIITGAVIVSIGTAISMAAMPTIIMSNVPLTDTAAANGLNTLLRSVGTSTCSAAVATILASLTITIGGSSFPGLDAFRTIFVLAGLAALAAAGVACLIPRSRRHEATHPDLHADGGQRQPQPEEKREIMVSGRLLSAADGRPVGRGTVTVLDSGGSPVDWDRTDQDGGYAVLLPGEGQYVMVASQASWLPVSEVLAIRGAAVHHDLHFRRPLALTGRIRHAGRAVADALVILVRPGGEVAASARSDGRGNYELPLPGSGEYVLSVIEPDARTTHTRTVVLPAPDTVIDVELGGREPHTGLRI